MNDYKIIYTKNKKTNYIDNLSNDLEDIFYPSTTDNKAYQLLPGITFIHIKDVVFNKKTKIICNANTDIILDDCTFSEEITIEGGKVVLISPTFLKKNQHLLIRDAEEVNIIQEDNTDVTYILDAKKISISGEKNKIHEVISTYRNIKNRTRTLTKE